MVNNYRSGDFFYEFTANILATLIGVIIGALSAIIITLFVINPYVRRMEYKTHIENNIETTILEFYGTIIIKMTAREAFALVREIRQARLKHQ